MHALNGCNSLSHFEVEKGSNLNFIHRNTFDGINLDTIIIPWCLLDIRSYVQNYDKITKIVITDDEIKIDRFSFFGLPNLTSVSFPYAKKIDIERDSACLSYFRRLSSQLSCDDCSLKDQIREVVDDFLLINKFPTESEELKYFQKKELNK